MFNLDEAIANWRTEILRAGLTREMVDELESHLRETIDANRKQTIVDDVAFENAVAQLGSPTQIVTEFNSNRSFDKKLRQYKIEKIIGAFGLATYAGMSIYGLFFSNNVAPTTRERFFGVLAIVMTLGVAIGACYLWRIVPVIVVKKARLVLGIGSMVIGGAITAVMFVCILPVIELTLSQLTVLILWSFLPMIADSTILVGLDEAAEKRRQQHA
jgi:hypothetical protein